MKPTVLSDMALSSPTKVWWQERNVPPLAAASRQHPWLVRVVFFVLCAFVLYWHIHCQKRTRTVDLFHQQTHLSRLHLFFSFSFSFFQFGFGLLGVFLICLICTPYLPNLSPPAHSFCSGAGDHAENLPSHKWAFSLSQLLISTLFNSHRCVLPPSPLNSVFFSQRWQKNGINLTWSQTGGILEFSVVVDEVVCQKASSLGPNVRPRDRRGRWRGLTKCSRGRQPESRHQGRGGP